MGLCDRTETTSILYFTEEQNPNFTDNGLGGDVASAATRVSFQTVIIKIRILLRGVGASQRVWRWGPMRGLGSGHVTCGLGQKKKYIYIFLIRPPPAHLVELRVGGLSGGPYSRVEIRLD